MEQNGKYWGLGRRSNPSKGKYKLLWSDNYSMCTFQTGKRYSCDLSASYNIGARYFLREYEKSISATRWRRIAAKVPSCATRITRTLATLIRVNAELRSM